MIGLKLTAPCAAAAALAFGGVFGTELSTTNYVSSGLVGQWDGLENVGRGQHVADTNVWVDLTGTAGDFQVQTGVAAFTSNGLQKTVAGIMATNCAVRTDVRTIEVVVSDIPVSGWVHAFYLRNGQTVSFSDANESGKRVYFFDYNNFGWGTASKPAQETVCAFYGLENSLPMATGFLQNGSMPEGTKQVNYWTPVNPECMSIGGRVGFAQNGDAMTTGYTVHAIRLYNRVLTRAEAAYNAALDGVRFFGAPEADLPYVFQNGVPKLRLSVVAEPGGGVVQGWSSTAAFGCVRAETAWLDLGSGAQTFRAVPLPGWRFAGWEDAPSDLVLSSDDPAVLFLTPWRTGMEVRARFECEASVAGYVTNGLVCRLDGLENAGVGLHDETTNVWKDLVETAGDFQVLTNVARFAGASLVKQAKGVMATNAVRRTDVLTMEGVVAQSSSAPGWANLLFIDEHQTLSFNNNYLSSGTRFYFVDSYHLGAKTDDRPDAFTFAATYSRETGTMLGTALYVNGAAPVRGVAANEGWMLFNAVGMSLGGRTGSENVDRGDATFTGNSLHGVRLYNRPLTEGELAYNAALDHVRFHGASTNTMAYRQEPEGAIVCTLRAWTGGMGGRVALAGGNGAATRVEKAMRAFGITDTATFTAIPEENWTFLHWRGDVAAIATGTTNDVTVGVSSTCGAALEAVFTSTGRYVREGLIGFWDAIENAGLGHHEATPRFWTDLTGETGDFLLNPYPGTFSEDALSRVRSGCSAQQARRSGIRTIEAVLSGTLQDKKWTMPVFVSPNQHLTFRDNLETGERQLFFDYSKSGVVTTTRPTNMTLTVTFKSESEADACYMNGVRVVGESYSNYWNDMGSTMSLGARNATMSEANTTDFRIHAVRFYDDVLTEDEIRRNARADAIRFFGASPHSGMLLIFR